MLLVEVNQNIQNFVGFLVFCAKRKRKLTFEERKLFNATCFIKPVWRKKNTDYF